MTRQTLLGLLFLVVGVVIIAAVLAPVLVAVLAHPPTQAPPISFALLITGIALAVGGAWLIPSSGVGPTVTQITLALGNTNLPFVGGRRAGDANSAATITVTTPPPPTLPKDGA